MKFPDCELPRLSAHFTWPARGLSALVSYYRTEFRSRVAANPMPSTSGSFAVKLNS